MPKLKWDETGERLYETGVRNGALYVQNTDGTYPKGVAWNGLTAVNETPSGAESNPQYADDIKYLNLQSAEEFGATIEAFTYPDEFAECDGSATVAPGVTIGQQTRKAFGFSYRTAVGNDVEGVDHGYKIHLIYGCKASPSEKSYATINDSPEAITFSWEVDTTPVNVTGYKPTSQLIIDSTTTNAEKLATLEDILYGTAEAEARLPLPDEVISIVGENSDDSSDNNQNENQTTTPTYTAVTPQEGDNPSEVGWYEESNGAYTLTEDTTVQEGKTYYTTQSEG